MAQIFTPWKINQLEIPNRLVRSATYEGMAQPDGSPGHDLINLTADLALGGVGLIIGGHAFVEPMGRAQPRQTGVHMDALVGPLTRLTDAVHKSGGLIAIQLAHAGGQTRRDFIDAVPKGPSPHFHKFLDQECGMLGHDEIYGIVEAFAYAAARAKAAEYDAVQIHAAHGYLAAQFLSPLTNQREDEFGGSLENRSRFVRLVLRAVRDAVGPDYPVFIKLNSEDCLEGGFTAGEALQVAARLDKDGVDAIEVSGGVAAAGRNMPSRFVKKPGDQGYFLDHATSIKQAVSCPIIVVGGFRSRNIIEEALDKVDAVSLCRPFIRQPRLAAAWQEGSSEDPTCISCNKCLKNVIAKGAMCHME